MLRRLSEMKRQVPTLEHSVCKQARIGHAPSIFWFRSDLRSTDNPGLHAASQFAGTKGLSAVFIVDHQSWRLHDYSSAKVDFILRTLSILQHDLLAKYNVPLHVIVRQQGEPHGAILASLCMQKKAKAVFWNVEMEADEVLRDAKAREYLLDEHGILVSMYHDQCAVEPGKVTTKEGRPSLVFTHFKRAWINYLLTNEGVNLAGQIEKDAGADALPSSLGAIPSIEDLKFEYPHYADADRIRSDWPVGENAAMERLSAFTTSLMGEYKDKRDIPSLPNTSRLSAYLSVGAISVRQCLLAALQCNKGKYDSGDEGTATWISELCWRDFYRHILYHIPRIGRGRPFKEATEQVPWRRLTTRQDYSTHEPIDHLICSNECNDINVLNDFKAWCDGQTGYPLIDAAMRCLKATGWMHNRLRMVVAMFLTKHLLIWWPHGEAWFMRHLIDGDFASNNGGWQWSASTGTDAQPYFRIFSPLSQSERFDTDGHFIRQWVGELRFVQGDAIHAPFDRLSKKEFEQLKYPRPIVDHKQARQRCLEAFKGAKK